MDKILIDNGFNSLKMPSIAGDIGYNLIARSSPKIVGKEFDEDFWEEIYYIEYLTNLKLCGSFGNNEDLATLIFPRSSLSKYNLSLANSVGVIDPTYTGEILVRFKYLAQPRDFRICGESLVVGVDNQRIYKEGDEIAQAVFIKPTHPQFLHADFEKIQTQRNSGGFGHTTNG